MNIDTGAVYGRALTAAVFTEFDEPSVLAFAEPGSDMVTRSTFEDLGDNRTRVTIHQTNVPEMFRSPEALAGFDRTPSLADGPPG